MYRNRNPKSPFFTSLLLLLLLTVAISTAMCTIEKRILKHKIPSITHTDVFPADKISRSHVSAPAFVFCDTCQLPPFMQWSNNQNVYNSLTLEDFLEKTNTTAFLVAKNDTIIYEKYLNGQTQLTANVIFSITKSFVTTLAGMAITEGYIDMEEPVAGFIPNFAEDERKLISIKHLLHMTSGLDFDDYEDGLKLARLYYHNNIKQEVYKAPLAYQPGSRFAYKSIEIQILGMCMEQATGTRMSDYLKQRIWDPLGMEYNAYFTLDSEAGDARMGGGLRVCSRDLMRLGKLYAHGGKWNGEQLLDPTWIDNIACRTLDDGWYGYSKGWWLDTYLTSNFYEAQDFYAAGFNGQFLYINPATNTVIVRQGLAKGGKTKGGNKTETNWNILIGSLNELLDGKPNSMHRVMDYAWQFPGVYVNEDSQHIEIVKKGEEWSVVRKNKKKALPLQWFCPRSLFNDKTWERFMINMNEQQVIDGLYYDNGLRATYYKKVE